MNQNERLFYAQKNNLEYQGEFEITLDALAEVRLRKCVEYGESRYKETDPEFNHWALFMDVWRKFIRLRQQMRHKDTAGLVETYRDLALYAIMAVQMLSRPQEKK